MGHASCIIKNEQVVDMSPSYHLSPLHPLIHSLGKIMGSEIFFILFLSFIASLLWFLLVKKERTGRLGTRKLPLGPKKLPLIGNIHQLGRLPHRSLHELSKTYGDLMLLHLGSVPTLVVSSADMAREIFKSHDVAFSGRPSFYMAKKIAYNSSNISLSPYGEYWREVRKIAVLELLTAKRVQSFGKIRDEEVALMIHRVSEYGTNPVDLSSLTFSMSNNVICRAAFGTMSPDDHGNSDGGRMTKFQPILLEVTHLAAEFNAADFFPWMAWVNKFNGVDRRIDKVFQDLDNFFNKVIEEHRDPERPKPDQEDIIDVLLRIQKDPNQEITLKDEQVKGVLIDLFSAGTDTTSAAIEWTMAELMRKPQVKEKAHQEVRNACRGKVRVEENDLQRLPYLKSIIKESLRLHPPAPLMIPRETNQNCTIDNKYEVPAKTRVIVSATAIGKDPKYWENPENFCPERFLNGDDVDFRGQHFELLPFGVGRRGCPGINFAISLVELALANLLFSFDWELPQGMSPRELDMEEALGITMHKKIPLCLVASPPKHDIH